MTVYSNQFENSLTNSNSCIRSPFSLILFSFLHHIRPISLMLIHRRPHRMSFFISFNITTSTFHCCNIIFAINSSIRPLILLLFIKKLILTYTSQITRCILQVILLSLLVCNLIFCCWFLWRLGILLWIEIYLGNRTDVSFVSYVATHWAVNWSFVSYYLRFRSTLRLTTF